MNLNSLRRDLALLEDRTVTEPPSVPHAYKVWPVRVVLLRANFRVSLSPPLRAPFHSFPATGNRSFGASDRWGSATVRLRRTRSGSAASA